MSWGESPPIGEAVNPRRPMPHVYCSTYSRGAVYHTLKNLNMNSSPFPVIEYISPYRACEHRMELHIRGAAISMFLILVGLHLLKTWFIP